MTDDAATGFDRLDKILPRYRALILAPSGYVLNTVRLNAADDPTALGEARSLMDGHAVELWDGTRYIEHFPVVV